MRELIDKTIRWAEDRNLIDGTDERAAAQMLKVMAEVGEFADEVASGARPERVDELGDVIVTLIITGTNLGIDIEEALGVAYEKIKNRKGKLINGVFVKEVQPEYQTN